MWDALTPQEKDGIRAGLILAILLMAGVGAYWYFYAKPNVEVHQKEIAVLEGDLKLLDTKLVEIADAEKVIDVLKQKVEFLEQIATKLPNSPDAPQFFNSLSSVLDVTRIDYSALAPERVLEREVYTEIPYRITCRARFHSFGQFLNLIEENPDRFMRVKTFIMENQDSRPSIHPVVVNIATFMFNTKG